MPKVSKGSASRQSKKNLFKRVKGHRGPDSKQLRLAKEAATRADVNAKVGRRRKKRDFRGLWIIRINAACRSRDIRYSQFIDGCNKAEITINRKALSEIAIHDPAGFDVIVEKARAALA